MKFTGIGINVLLTIGLTCAGFYLLSVDSFTVSQTTLTGAALYLLVLCVLCLAGFSAAIAHALMRGTLRPPPSIGGGTLMDRAHYRAEVIARFWPFVAVSVVAFFLAFILA